jgi:DNA repair exonuclease SbcCD nuclease subunit
MRFLHTADMHLGTAFRSRSQVGRELQEALRRSFEDLATAAIERQVDMVLIAGDLFEANRVQDISLATRAGVLTTLGRLAEAGIPIFIAPGNHDPITPAGVYRQLQWPGRAVIFDSLEPRAVKVEKTNPPTVVHGVAHTSSRIGDNLVRRIEANDDGRFHIALVHCNVQGRVGAEQEENYAPCESSDFLGRGIGYWALGHLHAPDVVVEQDDPPTVAAYCGCLCGLGYGDLGPRGCYFVTVGEDRTIQREFLPIGRVRWEELQIQPKPEDDVDAIEMGVRRHVQSLSLGDRQCCLRVKLSGRSQLFGRHEDAEWDEQADRLREELGLLDMQFDLQLRPAIDWDHYADRPHILGELIRTYREMVLPDGGVDAGALNDVLDDESLRRPEAEYRRMTEDQALGYRRRVLDRAMDLLIQRFVAGGPEPS